jgi:hypothetical protein
MGALPAAYRHSTAPQIAIGTALLLRGRVLSLYVHHAFAEQQDLEVARRLAADWLACVRKANPAPPVGS